MPIDIAGLLSQIRPFNPNAGTGIGVPTQQPQQPQTSSNSLKDLLAQITGAQQQVPVQPQRNILQTIIEALASGVATGTSRDPSATLSAQLGGIQERRSIGAAQERQRQSGLEALKLQLQMDAVKDTMGEERQIRAETRSEQSKIRLSKVEEEQAVAAYNREFSGKEKLLNIGFKQNKELSDIDNVFKAGMQIRSQDFQSDLAALESKDKRTAKIADASLSLISFGMPVDTAYSIAKKLFNDEKLTESEIKLVSKTQAQAVASKRRGGAVGGSSSGGGGGLSSKQAFALVNRFASEDLVQLSDGSIVSLASLPSNQFGKKEPIGNDAEGKQITILKSLSPAEASAYAASTVLPAIRGAMKTVPKNQVQVQKVEGTKDTLNSQYFDSIVDKLRGNKVPDAEIIQMIKEEADKNPDKKDVLNGVLIRKGLSGAKKLREPIPFKDGTR